MNGLADLARVDGDFGEVFGESEFGVEGGAAESFIDDRANEVLQEHGFFLGSSALVQGKQLAGEFVGAKAGEFESLEFFCDGRGEAALLAEEGDAAHDAGEDVVEIVRDAPGDPAGGFKFAGASAFFAEAGEFLLGCDEALFREPLCFGRAGEFGLGGLE